MDQETLKKLALDYHKGNGVGNGKIETVPKVSVKTRAELSLAYTPGVAAPCRVIADNPEEVYNYTVKPNTVFVVSDGSAVLGLGNIGCRAGLPVMEGKALLFKIFGGIDAYPIILDTQDTEEIIETVKRIAPGAGGINLEDISAPRCFEVEDRLSAELDIPVFHDDQHGTAVVTLAGLTNALKITGKSMDKVKIVVNGSGAAGIAIARLLLTAGARNIIMCDRKGALSADSADTNPAKLAIAKLTNPAGEKGKLTDVIRGADVFVGVSAKGALTGDMIRTMAKGSMVFAMANPDPEILPDEAKAAGAAIVATGRSDFPNQINNCLGFPGIFRGLLDVRASRVTDSMKMAAGVALGSFVTDKALNKGEIVPSVYDWEVYALVAEAVGQAAVKDGAARIIPAPGQLYRETMKLLKDNRRRFFR